MPVVHVMVQCSVVRRVCWVACGGRLRWCVVVIELVGVGGFQGVVMVLVVPCSLALREWRSLYGVNVRGKWSLAGLPG